MRCDHGVCLLLETGLLCADLLTALFRGCFVNGLFTILLRECFVDDLLCLCLRPNELNNTISSSFCVSSPDTAASSVALFVSFQGSATSSPGFVVSFHVVRAAASLRMTADNEGVCLPVLPGG